MMNKIIFSIFLLASTLVKGQLNYDYSRHLTYSWLSGKTSKFDPSGNLITIGSYSSISDLNPDVGIMLDTCHSTFDLFINKMDSSGNQIWTKTIKGSVSTDAIYCRDIDIDEFGNIYILGYRGGSLGSGFDFDPSINVQYVQNEGADRLFVIKLDNNGNYIWHKLYQGLTNSNTQYFQIAVMPDFSFKIVGNFEGSVLGLTSRGQNDIFISSYDSIGNFRSIKQIGGTGNDELKDIEKASNGDLLIAGNFNSVADFDPSSTTYNLTTAGYRDIFILKIDSIGNFIWVKQIGGSSFDRISQIHLSENNNIFITGDFEGIVDFDPNQSTFNLESFLNTNYQQNGYIAKYDSAMNIIWAKVFYDNDATQSYSIATDNFENVFAVGNFSEIVDFDPSSLIFNLTSIINNGSNYSNDIYFVSFDSSGNFSYGYRFGGRFDDVAHMVITNKSYIYIFGSIVTIGGFPVNINPTNNGTYNLDVSSLFIQKYNKNQLTNLQFEKNIEIIKPKIYPNPFNFETNLILNRDVENLNLEIYNISGQKCNFEVLKNHDCFVIKNNIKNPSGIYFFILRENNDIISTGKLIVQ